MVAWFVMRRWVGVACLVAMIRIAMAMEIIITVTLTRLPVLDARARNWLGMTMSAKSVPIMTIVPGTPLSAIPKPMIAWSV